MIPELGLMMESVLKKLRKGDAIVVMKTKPRRKRESSNSKYYAKNRRKGVRVRCKNSYKHDGIKA